MKKKIITIICCVAIVGTIVYLQIPKFRSKKMLKNAHESELREMLETLETFTNQDFYERVNGYITETEKYKTYYTSIFDFHKKYHGEEVMPRDSSTWSHWTYYTGYRLDPVYFTHCPLCLFEVNHHSVEIDQIYMIPFFKETNMENRTDNLRNLLYVDGYVKNEYSYIVKYIQDKENYKIDSRYYYRLKKSDIIAEKKEDYGSESILYYVPKNSDFKDSENKLIATHNKFHLVDFTKEPNIMNTLPAEQIKASCPLCYLAINEKRGNSKFDKITDNEKDYLLHNLTTFKSVFDEFIKDTEKELAFIWKLANILF